MDDVLNGYSNQNIPFDYLVEKFQGDRDVEPLNIRALFNVLNTPWETPQLDGLVCDIVHVDRGAAQFDLSLMIDLDITRRATLAFTSDIFDPATASRLLDNYMCLLDQVLADPGRRIADYEMSPRPSVCCSGRGTRLVLRTRPARATSACRTSSRRRYGAGGRRQRWFQGQ